uniref:Putative galactose oxidase n=1 Tax=Emericella variicolor TaxID=1549217 RepID=A0A1L7NQ74_EMEVA|nr:putative galactose oxidase [Aspergillus stellatus]
MTLSHLALLLAAGLVHGQGLDPITGDPSSFSQSPPLGQRIPRRTWNVQCDSNTSDSPCSNTIDENVNTLWLSNSGNDHEVVVDLGETRSVNAIEIRPGSQDGWIEEHTVYVSADNTNWGDPVSFGTWNADASIKYSIFDPKQGQYVRLVSQGPQASISDLNVWEYTVQKDEEFVGGIWGPTIDLPVIAVAGAVNPLTGEVMVWSAYTADDYNNSPSGFTLMAIWDPATNSVSKRNITETHHDMFCPGTSWDGSGKLVVSGGADSRRTSLFSPVDKTWIYGPAMKQPRGYQSSATLSNGDVFVVGGSWNGGMLPKSGEVYSPETNAWTNRPGCKVEPMLTNDKQGIYRSDNHGWMFGWKNGTVFQAGPSKAMNWYHTEGTGSVTSAGIRSTSDDAMSGSAVMYDAVAGKIITAGGSPSYQDTDGTNVAFDIEIDDVDVAPIVNPATNENGQPGMNYPRVFHTSVLLPDGTVFLAGGQVHGVPFNEDTAQLIPELYIPRTNSFETDTPNSVIRVYHSISLLLPDGRVFNGGGGLCGNCAANHLDAQVYTPRYLVDEDGNLAARPEISSVTATELKPGHKLRFTTTGAINSASLVRYGSTSHTVNTDQRRVPLDPLNSVGTNEYEATLPSDSGILLPGWWMLFVLNDYGVPSVSKTIQVTL